MDNLVFKCPTCNESITLMDIVGAERLQSAISWCDQVDIYEEWIRAIKDFEIRHTCS